MERIGQGNRNTLKNGSIVTGDRFRSRGYAPSIARPSPCTYLTLIPNGGTALPGCLLRGPISRKPETLFRQTGRSTVPIYASARFGYNCQEALRNRRFFQEGEMTKPTAIDPTSNLASALSTRREPFPTYQKFSLLHLYRVPLQPALRSLCLFQLTEPSLLPEFRKKGRTI